MPTPSTTFGYSFARADPKRWWQPTMAFIWDLFVFLGLVAVGLVVLNLLARTR
jgi:hypothetical protein